MDETYDAASFRISVPEGCVEDSIHVVRLPRGSRAPGAFQPSIVIKRERAGAPIDLAARLTSQVTELARELVGFSLLERKMVWHGPLEAGMVLYDWGVDDAAKIRQRQLLIRSADGLTLHVLTASDARALFATTDPLVAQIFATFTPRSR